MLFALELNDPSNQTGLLIAFLISTLGSIGAFFVWVFKSAMPAALNAYRTDVKEIQAKSDMESERERQFFAKEMVTRDAVFTTNIEKLVGSIDKLAIRLTSVEMTTKVCGYRLPLAQHMNEHPAEKSA